MSNEVGYLVLKLFVWILEKFEAFNGAIFQLILKIKENFCRNLVRREAFLEFLKIVSGGEANKKKEGEEL